MRPSRFLKSGRLTAMLSDAPNQKRIMPLSTPKPRSSRHTRTITLEGFHREDGLVDIEGTLTDRKSFDFPNFAKDRPANSKIHEMRVRITVDSDFNVREAEASTDSQPWDGVCETIAPDYSQLVGLNLTRGFRKAVAERFGKVKGCTHINELLGVIPTAAFQTFSGTLRALDNQEQMAAIMDTCHAMRRSGEPVRKYYPSWYVKSDT